MNQFFRLCLVSVTAFALACGGNNEDNNGANNGANNNNNNGTTPNNGSTTIPGDTTDPDPNNNPGNKDCTAAAQACDPANEINDGFECYENVCRASCSETSPCQAGSACVSTEGTGAFCLPSECSGWLDKTSCDAGESCVSFGNEAFLCNPAGTKAAGEECAADSECGPAMLCGPVGVCTPVCGSNSDCGDDRCIQNTLGTGAGFCAPGCDSFSVGQCDEGFQCELFTLVDSVCMPAPAEPDDAFGACTPPTQAQIDAGTYVETCGEGTSCINFGDGIGRCLPYCNLTAGTDEANAATCLGGTYEGEISCKLLGEEGASIGFCFEQCTTADFATDRCSNEADACAPLTLGNVCFPAGENTVGESCNPSGTVLQGCDGTSRCVGVGGSTTGICSPYCEVADPTNDFLGCIGAQECVQVQGNLGYCEQPCTPNADFIDAACPTGQQNCAPADIGEDPYCATSGSKAIGAGCTALSGECLAGDTCINSIGMHLEGDFDNPFAGGTCTGSCTLWADDTGCPTGQVCNVNFLTMNRAVGYCSVPDETLAPGTPCAADSVVCGDNSVCLDLGRGLECIEICDLRNDGCSNGACRNLFASEEVHVGFCN